MKIKTEVFDVLKQGTLSDLGNEYFLPNITLDRKLYTDTNKVLEGLGFKWNKKSKSHINSEDVSDKFYNMIDTGEWVDVKKELQFFPTPKKIVDRMIEKIQWNKHLSVLEPSCGLGNIAFNLPDMELEVDCVEINSEFIDKLKLNEPNNSNSYGFYNLDFMNFEPTLYKYDIVVANPPFSKLQDIKHFNKMIDCLKPNGQLVCILSASSYDENSSIKLRQEFTKFVDEKCEIEFVDEGEFKESGTNVKTIMVTYINK
jgi:SAM-dependent methyltransferase